MKVFRGCCPAQGVARPTQDHRRTTQGTQALAEFCLAAGSSPARGRPTSLTPEDQPATPPHLRTAAPRSLCPAAPLCLGTEAAHSPWRRCLYRYCSLHKRTHKQTSYSLSTGAQIAAWQPEEPSHPTGGSAGGSDWLVRSETGLSELKGSDTMIPSPGFHRKHRLTGDLHQTEQQISC